MNKTINNINEVSVGVIVIDGVNGGYAKVRQCQHGNRYYAMLSWFDDNLPGILNHESLPTVYDTDIDYIPCCG